MKPAQALRPPGTPSMVRRAITHLREARLELIAAGKMSDASEIDVIRKRLEAGT